MDLSPYMLAVAELRERQWEQRQALQRSGASPAAVAGADAAAVGADAIPGATRRQRITYKHGESTAQVPVPLSFAVSCGGGAGAALLLMRL